MTAGTVQIGTTTSRGLFFYKNWSGGNSSFLGTFRITYRWRKGGGLLKTVYRVPAKPNKLSWNNYTMIGRRGFNTYITTPISMAYCYGHNRTWGSNDELELQSKLQEKANGHSFNMGVAIAESKESYGLAVGTVKRFAVGILQLRKGNISGCLRALGASPRSRSHMRTGSSRPLSTHDVSSLWLEIQYGWRPLLQDVYESQKALAAITDKMRRTSFSANHSIRFVEDTSWLPYYSVQKDITISRRIIAELNELPSAGRSLSLQNPGSVVWELTPFSFVADWFIPIGTYMDVLNSIPNLQGRFLTTERVIIRGSGVGKSGGYIGSSVNCYTTEITRTSSTSLSVPRPEFKPLPMALSSGHIKNAIALLHQQLK